MKIFGNKEFKYENYQVDDLSIQLKTLKRGLQQIESCRFERGEATPTKIVQIDLNKNGSQYVN